MLYLYRIRRKLLISGKKTYFSCVRSTYMLKNLKLFHYTPRGRLGGEEI
jgi:hypothetical protein